ncbi:MAG: hypothetical protein ABIJ47_10815, partial [Candidatus Bathyarchaeota archaeon]
AGVRGDFKSLTKAVFWATLGSLATLYVAFPDSTLTTRIIPVEIALLAGMALGYLSFGKEETG